MYLDNKSTEKINLTKLDLNLATVRTFVIFINIIVTYSIL